MNFMKLITKNSDYIGATSSGLCMLHCFFTPIIFLYLSASATFYQEISISWYVLNYLFLAISFIAIYYSVKNSSNLYVRVSLYLAWSILLFLIINENFEITNIPELFTYLSGFTLSGLHIYNLNYCTCDDEECCAK